jgi:hypothetical protein
MGAALGEEKATRLASRPVTANHPLHLTAAAFRFFESQRLTSRRGR